jgi:hypothetical protein
MDVPARQSYTMAVVEPRERTATAGVTSLARALAQAPGPALAGSLLVPFGLGVPLIATGALKVVYDVLLFLMFRRRPAPEEVPLDPLAIDGSGDVLPDQATVETGRSVAGGNATGTGRR